MKSFGSARRAGAADKELRPAATLASNVNSSVNLLDSLGGSAPAFPSLGGGSGADAYFVQVGAFQNRAQAEGARDKYKTAFATLLADHNLLMCSSADLKDSKGPGMLSQVVGFEDPKAASAILPNLRTMAATPVLFPETGAVARDAHHDAGGKRRE